MPVRSDVATTTVTPRDRGAELEKELARITRRGGELAKQKPSSRRDEALAEARAEYRRVHAKWVAVRNQTRLPI